MRLSIESFRHRCGAVIVAVALGGCSNAQPLSLPAGSAAPAARDAFDAPRYLPKGRIGPLDLLELQADGKLPGPVGRAALRRGLEIARHHGRPHYKVGKRAAPVGMWLSDTYESYLVGQSSRGNKTEATIDAGKNGCTYPGAVKVDASQNVWTTCETDTALTGDVVQEYSNKGALEGSYAAACPLTKSPGCKYWYAYGYDGASDGEHVFAALTFWEIKTCNPSCVLTYGPGFEWWNAGSSSATPTLIALPYGSPVNYVDYVDVDDSGNLWFDYYGCSKASQCGYGLGEIESPTSSSWQFVSILPPGAIERAGGVYVGASGAVLSVTDQEARTVSQYALPLSPSGSPISVLGPTPTDYFGEGTPVAGGYNAKDGDLVQADAEGWLDTGVVASNKWKPILGLNVRDPGGAAYTPSDK